MDDKRPERPTTVMTEDKIVGILNAVLKDHLLKEAEQFRVQFHRKPERDRTKISKNRHTVLLQSKQLLEEAGSHFLIRGLIKLIVRAQMSHPGKKLPSYKYCPIIDFSRVPLNLNHL